VCILISFPALQKGRKFFVDSPGHKRDHIAEPADHGGELRLFRSLSPEKSDACLAFSCVGSIRFDLIACPFVAGVEFIEDVA